MLLHNGDGQEEEFLRRMVREQESHPSRISSFSSSCCMRARISFCSPEQIGVAD
jgi:hypothetical protein